MSNIEEFLKLRRMFLLSQKDSKNIDLPTSIRISAKLHEIDLMIKFLADKNMESIYEIRKK